MSSANVLARVGTFLGNLAIIRLLGLDLLGELGLIESWLSVAMMFSIFGLSSAVTKYVAQYLESDPEQIGEITATAMVLGTVASAVVGFTVFLVLGVPNVSMWVPGQTAGAGPTMEVLTRYAVIIPCLVVLFTFKHLITGLLYGLQVFEVFVVVNVVIGVISFPLAYVLVRWQGLLGALAVRGVLTVVEIALLAYPARRVLRRMGANLSLNRFGLNSRRLTAFGLPTFLGELVANPVQSVMLSVLAGQPGGIAQVGLVTTAQRMSSLASFVPGSMAATVMPVLSTELGRGDFGRFRDGILVALRMLWLTTLPVVLFLMAACPTLLGMLYGSEYVTASTVTLLFLILALLVGVNQSADRALAAANRVWLSTGNNLLWTTMFVPLALFLITRGLALGYALAMLASFALYVMIQLGWLGRLFGVRLTKLLPLLSFSLPLIVVACVSAVYLNTPVQVIAAGILALFTLLLQWRLFLTTAERQAFGRRGGEIWTRGKAFAHRVVGSHESSNSDTYDA
jgi:O-antigen/teichoic acid export membrane protein